MAGQWSPRFADGLTPPARRVVVEVVAGEDEEPAARTDTEETL